MKKRTIKSCLIVAVGTFTIIALACLAACFLSPNIRQFIHNEWEELTWESAVADGQQKGNMIIDAIKKYQNQNDGHIPESLDDLIPDYLQTIPQPLTGTKTWSYWKHDDTEGYTLEFATSRDYPSCSYDSEKASWHVDE